MLRNRLLGLLLATGTVLFCLPPTLAVAETAAKAPSKLVLSVVDKLEGTPARRVTLTCDPTGGNHPFAAAACRLVAKADGNFTRLNAGLKPDCTKENAPRTVSAHGTWRGRPVDYRATFVNSCLADVRTDPVFRF